MPSIKKILCALDLSDATPRVAEYAVLTAKAYDAEIVVAYAAPPLTQYAGFEIQPKLIEMFSDEISTGAEKNMEKAIAEHFAGVKTESLIKVGDPADVIIDAAKSVGADMIVMGTHGRRGYDRFLLGSVAEKVVKGAKLPVLTVPNI